MTPRRTPAGALGDPALTRLWAAIAQRLQRNGLSPSGIVELVDLTREERHALAGVIGRPVIGERVRVRLEDLDGRLRETGISSGLVAAVERVSGPLVDRKGIARQKSESRAQIWAAGRTELEAQGLAAADWVEPWLESVRPIVNRLPEGRGETVLVTAVRGLARLGLRTGAADGEALVPTSVARTEFASALGGSSHALDDGSVLSTLILRGISASIGEPAPRTAAERRLMWERAGVQSDEVSTTVLTLGLRPAGDSALASAVRARSAAGCETHLTLRDLRRIDGFVSDTTPVWVCENPRVLEASMDAGSRAVMVCTMGHPTVVVTALLERLRCQQARLQYHGDFDWPGIGIANRIIASFGALPWRMRATDYEAALTGTGQLITDLPQLEGLAVPTAWDPSLAESMLRHGRAVHEELVVESLVEDVS